MQYILLSRERYRRSSKNLTLSLGFHRTYYVACNCKTHFIVPQQYLSVKHLLVTNCHKTQYNAVQTSHVMTSSYESKSYINSLNCTLFLDCRMISEEGKYVCFTHTTGVAQTYAEKTVECTYLVRNHIE